jgi:LPS sulfotransferase NodH
MTIDSYIVCTSPRSGSTLLCYLLSQTGVAGNPGSWFHEPSLEAWLDDYGLPRNQALSERELLGNVFRAATAAGSRGTGVFGLRLQSHSFAFFTKKLAVLHPDFSNDRQRLAAAFGQTSFIHLTRDDKLAQAISYVKAEQSGLWHMSSDGTELERLAPPRVPTYDAGSIRRRFEQFANDDSDWNRWFDREQIDPLRTTYEALAHNPRETLCRVLDHLGLDREAARGVNPDVAKLADSDSRQWADRFRKEHGPL